jgi:hypothetical protein
MHARSVFVEKAVWLHCSSVNDRNLLFHRKGKGVKGSEVTNRVFTFFSVSKRLALR